MTYFLSPTWLVLYYLLVNYEWIFYKRSMRVLQILPELNSGGVERGTLEIATGLNKAGHTALVLSNGGGMVSQLESHGARHLTLPVHRKSLRSITQIQAVKAILEEEQIDIIHARSRIPAWIAYFAWKSLPTSAKTRFMTTFHGYHSVSPYSAIMTRGERVITVSDSIRTHLATHYPKTNLAKVTTIHRGVEDTQYSFDYTPSPTSSAIALRHRDKGLYILTLPGRLTAWKGGRTFLKIIRDLKETGIPVMGWFAGGAHEKRTAFEQTLRQEIKALGLSQHVRLLGHRDDMKDIMKVSDIVISLSSKPEAFGRVTLEALRLGKPVLANNHGGVSEQLAALFPEGAAPVNNRKAWVHTLTSWHNTRPIVQPHPNPFTLESMQNKTLKVYEELLASEVTKR